MNLFGDSAQGKKHYFSRRCLTNALLSIFILIMIPTWAEAKLIFRTNFENNFSLGTPRVVNDLWWQDLSYAEGGGTTGRLPGNGNPMIQFLVSKSNVNSLSDLSSYIRSEIQNVIGPENRSTKAWYMHKVNNYRSGPPNYTRSRISLILQPGSNTTDKLDQLYIEYDMKFIPDFNSSMTSGSWYMLWENTVQNNTNKLMVFRNNDNDPILWKLESYNDKPQVNYNAEVPINRWFKLGIYYKHSVVNDGAIIVYVNNKKIFDYRGATASSGGASSMNILKNYGNKENVGHWVDNFEIHDSVSSDSIFLPAPILKILN